MSSENPKARAASDDEDPDPQEPEPTALDRILGAAEDQLWADFERAGVFDHSGVIGATREIAVARFLEEHLPPRFVVTTGKAVDRDGLLTPQLDLIVYDGYLSAPLLSRAVGPELVPAEALVAVVEIKSMFSRAEARVCLKAATAIAKLNVYNRNFVPARAAGESASDGAPRCMYSILAFDSDIVPDGWTVKEWKRLIDEASKLDADTRRIDRLTVLSRGLLVPTTRTGQATTNDRGVLRDWFLHLSDFLVREAARRQPYDWHPYARPQSDGWERLEGYESVNALRRERRQAKPAPRTRHKHSKGPG
jgi:hypothetical protein